MSAESSKPAGSLVSSIRSAARATSSAYRRLPIRWRLAGGSAALTMVILCGFATLVGVLTTRRIDDDFRREVAEAADDLAFRITIFYDAQTGDVKIEGLPRLDDYAASDNAVIRIVYGTGQAVGKPPRQTRNAPFLGPPELARSYIYDGYLVQVRKEPITGLNNQAARFYIQYGRPIADIKALQRRVQFFLALGVLGGTVLALLAGLSLARRAMRPIAELTETARRIERTRDTGIVLPEVEAEDEVAELAKTLDNMLRSLGAARSETEAALKRQREFVADASHELRTPLTSVLANLDLLVDYLQDGDLRDAAASALRSSQRMGRLVADLLLLARADSGRHVTVARHFDLGEVVTEAAAELGPVAGEHELSVSVEPAPVVGARDELHRLALNLMENAVKHTDAGTAVRATVRLEGNDAVLRVEDDGPGIPPDLATKVFERFVRGSADRGGSSGLGLAIVRAVAETHGGQVWLEPKPDGTPGARFVVRLPSRSDADQPGATPAFAAPSSLRR